MSENPPAPGTQSVAEAARVSGIELSMSEANAVAEATARVWGSLETLRSMDWSFIDGAVEPAHGDAWLRRWAEGEHTT